MTAPAGRRPRWRRRRCSGNGRGAGGGLAPGVRSREGTLRARGELPGGLQGAGGPAGAGGVPVAGVPGELAAPWGAPRGVLLGLCPPKSPYGPCLGSLLSSPHAPAGVISSQLSFWWWSGPWGGFVGCKTTGCVVPGGLQALEFTARHKVFYEELRCAQWVTRQGGNSVTSSGSYWCMPRSDRLVKASLLDLCRTAL